MPRLSPAAFEELGAWIGSFEALWEEWMDPLQDVLAAMQATPKDAHTTTNGEEGST